MSKLLDIKHISKNYITESESIEAIRDITLEIEKGSITTIVGSSGCGKSSLLSILSGIDHATSGEFKFSKKDPVIGYMLQSDALFPWLTIYENAILGLKIKKKDTFENLEYVKRLLDTYKLSEFNDKYPSDLSGGMKQRVALIRTLALKPDILLLDEPFSALDYQSRLAVSDDVYRIIRKEGITTIMVSHDIAEAISMSDRIVVLSKRPATIKNIYEKMAKAGYEFLIANLGRYEKRQEFFLNMPSIPSNFNLNKTNIEDLIAKNKTLNETLDDLLEKAKEKATLSLFSFLIKKQESNMHHFSTYQKQHLHQHQSYYYYHLINKHDK